MIIFVDSIRAGVSAYGIEMGARSISGSFVDADLGYIFFTTGINGAKLGKGSMF